MKKSVAVLLAVGVFSSFFPVAVNANSFIRGDANSDGSVDISDGMTILRYLFQGAEEPGCLDANDSNDSGTLDLSDAIYLLSFLFFGAEAPPAPYWGCGSDPTLDNLGCETQSDACTPAVTGFSYIGTNEFGYQEFEHEQTGLEFVLVPGGSFSMGSLPEETGSQPHEWPVHTVPLSPFLIAKYEVTQKQYADVMGSNPAHFKGEEAPEGMNTDELPVESVSWNELHEEEGFLKQTKLALPTEAQWEYAARAGTVTAFSFGDDAERIDEYAWYEGNSNGVPHPVGEKLPNDFGLYDMHGNAWEWTQDEYSPDFYETMSATVQDPVAIVCPSAATKLVSCRGGSLASEVLACRAAHRDPAVQEFLRNPALGFRPVFSFAPGEGVGCTNQGALNYDEDAVIDDGSCVFDAPEIPLIRGFTTIGLNAQGLPEYRHDRTGIVCVRLPGGHFNMGVPGGGEGGQDTDSPVHEVELSPFLIGKYEVTQGEWQLMMNGTNPSFNHPCTHDWFENRGVPAPRPRLLPYDEQLRRPVENVSWRRIQDFEERTGFTLPTEAQWEYAARAGTDTTWSFGEDESQLEEHAWLERGERFSTAPVGQLRPNQFGLHDMYGNVAEWCEDIYSRDFYSTDQAGDLNPEAKWVEFEGMIPHRVVRGGDYRDVIEADSSSSYRLRSGAREAVLENTPWNYRATSPSYPGFRVVFNLAGCTDPAALNYEANAVIDDGSCETELAEYWGEIDGFRSFGVSAAGFPQYRHGRSGIVCVRLPGGRFNMGSPEGEAGRGEDEGPIHLVELSPFLIGKYEVTQGQWEAVMGYDPQRGSISFNHPETHDWNRNRGFPPPRPVILPPDQQILRPVDSVSWVMIQAFEESTGFTLPTEAQWEYAARGGSEEPWFFGNDNSSIGRYAWFEAADQSSTNPIGRLEANPYGLHDLYGNVAEWCEDVYSPSFYSEPEASGLNPVSRSGPGAGPTLRVLRGGDYIDSLNPQANVFDWTPNFNRLRSAGREALAEDVSGTNHPGAPGFRVVFNLFGE